jgi:3-oxoacyl-[acyl-carrier protein] reductase
MVRGNDLFQLSDEQWNTALELKFHGARRLTLRAWDALKASNGAVVFTSGTGAKQPNAATAMAHEIALADPGVMVGLFYLEITYEP